MDWCIHIYWKCQDCRLNRSAGFASSYLWPYLLQRMSLHRNLYITLFVLWLPLPHSRIHCMHWCVCAYLIIYNIISVLHNVKHLLYIVPYIYVYIVATWWRGIWQPWHHQLQVAKEGSAQHGISPSHYMCCYLQRRAEEDGQAGVGVSWLDWSRQEVDIHV